MRQEWIIKYTASKPYRGKPAGRRITVEAGLHKIGAQSPYFSITGEIGRPGRGANMGGCIHGEILRHWPGLAPVVALHLSDGNGVPMHAEANGWYYLAGYYGGANQQYHFGNGTPPKDAASCLKTWAEHVRVPLATAAEVAQAFRDVAGAAPSGVSPQAPYWARVRAAHDAWMHHQRPRWKEEAARVIDLLSQLLALQEAGCAGS